LSQRSCTHWKQWRLWR